MGQDEGLELIYHVQNAVTEFKMTLARWKYLWQAAESQAKYVVYSPLLHRDIVKCHKDLVTRVKL